MSFDNIHQMIDMLEKAEPSYNLTLKKNSITQFLDKLTIRNSSEYNVLLVNFCRLGWHKMFDSLVEKYPEYKEEAFYILWDFGHGDKMINMVEQNIEIFDIFMDNFINYRNKFINPKTRAALLKKFFKTFLHLLTTDLLCKNRFSKDRNASKTLLHCLATYPYSLGTFKLISPLINDWNKKDDCGRTPLFYAVKYSDLNTIKYLLKKSNNYSIMENVVGYPNHNLFSAAIAFNCRFDVARFLAKNMNSLFSAQKNQWIEKGSLHILIMDLAFIDLPWKQLKKRLKLVYQFYPEKKNFGNLICRGQIVRHYKSLFNWLVTLPHVIENLDKETISYLFQFIKTNKSGMEIIKKIKQKNQLNLDYWSILDQAFYNHECQVSILEVFMEALDLKTIPNDFAKIMLHNIHNNSVINTCNCCQKKIPNCVENVILFLARKKIDLTNISLKGLSNYNYKNILDVCLLKKNLHYAQLLVENGFDPSKSSSDNKKWLNKAQKIYSQIQNSKRKINKMIHSINYSPPKNLLPRGGIGYIKTCLELSRKNLQFYNIVRHATPYDLAKLSKDICKISPKADGVPVNFSPMGINWKAEKVILNNKSTYYLVFNTQDTDSWETQMKTVSEYYDNYEGIKNWSAKPVKVVRQNLINQIKTPPETDYPNDGWIIQNSRNNAFYKVKPLKQLTVDLEYNSKSWISKEGVEINLIDYNNQISPGIWRCYYNQELGLWQPQELRPDKKRANPYHVFLQLTRDQQRQWTPDEISQINYWNQIITNRTNRNKSLTETNQVLNLGCGLNKNGSINCDIDLATLDKNDIWINLDLPWLVSEQVKYFGKIWHRINLLELAPINKVFKQINMNFCLNQLKTDRWITEINQRSSSGTQLNITFLDSDLLPNNRIDNSFGFIHKLDSSVKVMFYHRHNTPIEENPVSKSSLISKLLKNRWKLVEEEQPNICNSFRKYYCQLIFKKY